MEKLLNTFVDTINNVMGVRSAYLLNNRGEILFPQSEKLGRSTLNAASALELVQAIGVFELAGEEVTEIELTFNDGQIVVYNNVRLNAPTKLGTQETFLVIIADKSFNKSHLRLVLNVSLAPIITDKKYKKLDLPVKIRKNSVLTRERLGDRDFSFLEKVRSQIT